MNDDMSDIKRVLIIGAADKVRRGLVSAFKKCLDQADFMMLDTSTQPLPDSQYDWNGLDLVVVDISKDKKRISSWYCDFPNGSSLPPAIFTDYFANVDDAGDLYRAGATDYLGLKHIKRNRLLRALGFAAEALQDRASSMADAPVPEPVEESTELMETIEPVEESTELMETVEPTGAVPEQVPEQIQEDAVTEVVTQVQPSIQDTQSTAERAEFINTGLMSILDRGKVKQSEHKAESLSEGRSDASWPFSYRDIEEGIAAFGDYKVLEYLGSGGTASVFKVSRESTGKVLAMKLFDVETADQLGKDRFKRGYELLQDIDHPHIGHIEELIDTGLHVAAILEYFPNGDLQTRISGQGHIPRDKAIYYATQIASGLNCAQDNGIMHRDLKPSNIMFREDSDSLALIDFGIAKRTDKEKAHHLTMEGQLVGTPYYTSPEQALGKDVDHRSDLYALGVILFEMLEGKRPFDGNSAIEIMTAHVRGDIPELSDPDEALNAIVKKLLAKSPDDRFESGLEVEHALQNLD